MAKRIRTKDQHLEEACFSFVSDMILNGNLGNFKLKRNNAKT